MHIYFFFSADSWAKSGRTFAERLLTLLSLCELIDGLLDTKEGCNKGMAAMLTSHALYYNLTYLTPPSIVTYLDGNWHAEVHGCACPISYT